MPHEVETMFYVGEVPWHGLGVQLPDVATAEEAIVAAGLDWEVEKRPLFIPTMDGGYQQIEDKYAVVRCTDGQYLGVVGGVYTPLQNREAFSFFDQVVETGEAKYVTAGSLRGGKRIWILAKMPGHLVVGDSDPVDQYLLLFNTHDGTTKVRMMVTPIRVVCNNTLVMALASQERGVALRHCSNIIDRVADVRDTLGLVNAFYLEFEAQANFLADRKVHDQSELDRFLDSIGLALPQDKEAPRIQATRDKITELFDMGGMGLDDSNVHSYWNAFNAVAEFVDHHRPTRVSDAFGSAQEARLDSAWFGGGARMKQLAWDTAMQLASIA